MNLDFHISLAWQKNFLLTKASLSNQGTLQTWSKCLIEIEKNSCRTKKKKNGLRSNIYNHWSSTVVYTNFESSEEDRKIPNPKKSLSPTTDLKSGDLIGINNMRN